MGISATSSLQLKKSVSININGTNVTNRKEQNLLGIKLDSSNSSKVALPHYKSL